MPITYNTVNKSILIDTLARYLNITNKHNERRKFNV